MLAPRAGEYLSRRESSQAQSHLPDDCNLQATRLATASDDDSSPIIMLWDLRNARAPEKILSGHDKGVLSLSWCKQDPDLLLSCGKDNRTLCWNPQTSEIVGELPSSNNWSFDVQWSPKNPDLIATASFDGRIGIHSLQATNADDAADLSMTAAADPNDIFNSLPAQSEASNRGVSLKQPPKWLRKPISASFGFGGQLVSTCNLPGEKGQTQSSVVHLRNVVTEPIIVNRAKRLQEAMESQSLADFCIERSKDSTTRPDDVANWKALQTLFQADSRDELVALLGFSKEDVASKVASAIEAFKKTPAATAPGLSAPTTPTAETTKTEISEAVRAASEVNGTAEVEGGSAEVTEASTAQEEVPPNELNLFGDSTTNGQEDDFFSKIGEIKSALPSHLADGQADSMAPSAAATVGSQGPPSAISDGAKTNTFRIYPSDESDADKLITRAIVLGDFESAVSLCVSTDRFADALLLAVRGGPELLARTQKAYFERRTTSLPYLRLFQSIVSDDLTDIVQNADLNEWQEVFVVICTFAKKTEEFVSLAEQLGQRLEFQYGMGDKKVAKTYRKNAVLCYLAAGKLEKVAGMWIDEMKEEEIAIRSGQVSGDSADVSLYSAHAEALQTFMEKISVFQSAVQYVDVDLASPTQDAAAAASGARSYKLAALYDCIHEYVEVLADQGLIASALQYIAQTPPDYQVQADEGGASARERLVKADQVRGGTGVPAVNHSYASTSALAGSSVAPAPAAAVASVASSAYAPGVPQVSQSSYDGYGSGAAYQPYGSTGYDSYNNSSYAPPLQQQQQPQPIQQQMAPMQPQQQMGMASMYTPQQPIVPAPPPPIMNQNGTSGMAPPQGISTPPPPPPKRDQGGWNDIPTGLNLAPKRTTSAIGNKSAPITSPFPMSVVPPSNGPMPGNTYGSAGSMGGALPPPPRGATPGARPGLTSPPPSNQYGRGPGPSLQGPPRPPPMGPPRGSTPGSGFRQGQPPAGGYAPGPGQVSMPPVAAPGQQGISGPMQQQQQQQYGAPPPQQQQGASSFVRPPMPPMPPQQQQAPPPHRSVTPGLGAGPPPQAARPASVKPATKYPPGDRSHIPESAKPIIATLTRELNRFKSITPPTQKRTIDDVDRRINLLFDLINCGTVDAKFMPGLHQLCQAIEARNQQAALGLHVQLASSSSGGDLSTVLVGIKLLISKMNQQ